MRASKWLRVSRFPRHPIIFTMVPRDAQRFLLFKRAFPHKEGIDSRKVSCPCRNSEYKNCIVTKKLQSNAWVHCKCQTLSSSTVMFSVTQTKYLTLNNTDGWRSRVISSTSMVSRCNFCKYRRHVYWSAIESRFWMNCDRYYSNFVSNIQRQWSWKGEHLHTVLESTVNWFFSKISVEEGVTTVSSRDERSSRDSSR